MREGGYSEQNEDDQKEKSLAKEMREYILVSRVINRETWLYSLGRIYIYYHLATPFEWLDDGYTTECRLGMIFLIGALLSYIVMFLYE